MWLTTFDNGMWHVVPCYEDGQPLQGHVPSPRCSCQPELEFFYDDEEESVEGITCVHNQLH